MKPPTPSKLLLILRTLFALQGQEVDQSIGVGKLHIPDLSHWIAPAVKMITPILHEFYSHGMRKVAVQLGIETVGSHTLIPEQSTMDLMRSRAEEGGGRSYNFPAHEGYQPAIQTRTVARKSLGSIVVVKTIRRATDAVLNPNRITTGFSPRTIDAVNQAALHLCRETLDTLATDIDTALEGMREILRRGLRYETRYRDVYESLRRSIGRIVNDPYRAKRIADTEFWRAIHAGMVLEAKAAPFKTVKIWRANHAGVCKRCKALNGLRRALDTPFIVLPIDSPYSHVQHPPLHPFCDCEMSIVRSDRRAA